MSRNILVYPHPINTYIIKQLGMPVEEFCELHSFSQGTISSWISRNKKVESLPSNFLYALSLSANKSMDYIYQNLLDLETEYHNHLELKKRVKAILD